MTLKNILHHSHFSICSVAIDIAKMSSYSSDEEDVRPVHADALREKEAYTREMMDMIRETKRKEMEKRRQE